MSLKVLLRGGKPLLKAGKVALSALGICCGPCGTGGGSGGCCTSGTCTIKTSSDCIAGGGDYLGDGTTCSGVDCSHGACCSGDSCFLETPSDCAAIGGTYQGDGTTCFDGHLCPSAPGACCNHGSCTVQNRDDCQASGGVFMGSGTDCTGSPCAMPGCGGCGFDAFDGSGRKFKRISWAGSRGIGKSCLISNPTDTCEASVAALYSREQHYTGCVLSGITGSGNTLTTFCDGSSTSTGFNTYNGGAGFETVWAAFRSHTISTTDHNGASCTPADVQNTFFAAETLSDECDTSFSAPP